MPGSAWVLQMSAEESALNSVKAIVLRYVEILLPEQDWIQLIDFPVLRKCGEALFIQEKYYQSLYTLLGKRVYVMQSCIPPHLGECLINCIFIETLINEQVF